MGGGDCVKQKIKINYNLFDSELKVLSEFLILNNTPKIILFIKKDILTTGKFSKFFKFGYLFCVFFLNKFFNGTNDPTTDFVKN